MQTYESISIVATLWRVWYTASIRLVLTPTATGVNAIAFIATVLKHYVAVIATCQVKEASVTLNTPQSNTNSVVTTNL